MAENLLEIRKPLFLRRKLGAVCAEDRREKDRGSGEIPDSPGRAVESIEGAHFLDIGCGSGFFPLRRCDSGAKRLLAVDLDPNSVHTTRKTLERYAPTWRKLGLQADQRL